MSFGRTIAQTLLLLAIVAGCAWLYFYRLDFAPPNIQIDEAIIAINAQSIAATGRDLRGELLPLYTQTADHLWYQPMMIYLTAIAIKVAPFGEGTVRVPAVVMSLLGVAWMFLVLRRAMQSLFLGAAAEARLALTPLQLTRADLTLDLERVRSLPASRLVITSPSPEIDEALARLMAAREVGTKPTHRTRWPREIMADRHRSGQLTWQG